MKKNYQRRMISMMLSFSMLLLPGCGREKTEETKAPEKIQIAVKETVGTPAEPEKQETKLEIYEGPLVTEGARGVTANGGIYVLPGIDEQMQLAESDKVNRRIDEISREVLHMVDGSDVYVYDDDLYIRLGDVGTVVLPAGANNWEKGMVYDLFAGKTMTPLEYLYTTYRYLDDQPLSIEESYQNALKREYTNRAIYDSNFTPEGMEKTLTNANWDYDGNVTLLDAEGNEIGTHNICMEAWDVRGSAYYLSEYAVFRTETEVSTKYQEDAEKIGHIRVVENFYIDMSALSERMLTSIEQFCLARAGENVSVSAENAWISGRYMIFPLEMRGENMVQKEYFFFTLLTGEVLNYQQAWESSGIDQAKLMEKVRRQMEEDYQMLYSQTTGQPFAWGHDEKLYDKTFSRENLANATILPLYESFQIFYDAYVVEGEAPIHREIEMPMLDWTSVNMSSVLYREDVEMYPGLSDQLDDLYRSKMDVGYLNYAVWVQNKTVIVAIGWFDSQLQWAGWDAVCINLVTGRTEELSDVLAYAGIHYLDFELGLEHYLRSLPEWPG